MLQQIASHQPVRRLLALILSCGLGLLGCATLPPAGPDQEILALRKQAVDYARQGDSNLAIRNWELAESFYRRSLESNESVDNLEGVVQSHFSLGFLYLNRSLPDAADGEFHLASELSTQLGSSWYRIQSLLNLAKVQLWRHNSSDALDLLDQGIAEFKAAAETKVVESVGPGVQAPKPSDDRSKTVQAAALFHNRAVALKDLKRYPEARTYLEQALVLNTNLKAIKERAGNLYMLASLDNAEAKYESALAKLDQAIVLDKQAESSEGIAADLYALSQVYLKLSNQSGTLHLQEAFDCLRRSYRASLAINDDAAVERCLPQLVELSAKLNRTNDQAAYAALLAKLRALKDKK